MKPSIYENTDISEHTNLSSEETPTGIYSLGSKEPVLGWLLPLGPLHG